MGIVDTIREKVGGGETKTYNESTERELKEHNISDRPMRKPVHSEEKPRYVVTRKSEHEAVVHRAPREEKAVTIVHGGSKKALSSPPQAPQHALSNVRTNMQAGIQKIDRGVQRVRASKPVKMTGKALDMTYGKAFAVARASRAHNAKGERVPIGSKSDVSPFGRASRRYVRAGRRYNTFAGELRSSHKSPNEYGLSLLGIKGGRQRATRSKQLTSYDPMTGASYQSPKPRRRRRRKKTAGTDTPHDNVWTFF